jgi:hypothetical protein
MLVGQLRRREAPAAPQPATSFFLPVFLMTIVNPMTIVVFTGHRSAASRCRVIRACRESRPCARIGKRRRAAHNRGRGQRGRQGAAGRKLAARDQRSSAIGILAFGIAGLAAA